MATLPSEADVLAMAPDAASVAAGKKLVATGKWSDLGTNVNQRGTAAWGLCQGSGKTPYQTRVDLAGPAFKCSCPSRKFPCKHALGLLLKLARAPVDATPPDWVQEWLESRGAKAEQKAVAQAKPFDATAEAKKRATRLKKTAAELDDLRRWMRDLVAGGIAGVPGRGAGSFNEQARRMVDAKAPGVARMLRDLGHIAIAGGPSWDGRFIRQLGRIDLLCTAVARAEELPEPLRREAEQAVGIPVSAAELATLPAIDDTWQCFAVEVEQEETLKAQRQWIVGRETGRVFQVLSFAHGAAPLDVRLGVNRQFQGSITPYPGGGWRAALPENDLNPSPIDAWHAIDSLSAFADRHADALAANPWLERFAAPVRTLTPTLDGDGLRVLDANGGNVSVTVGADARWQLLAVSGGGAVDAVIEVSLAGFRVLDTVATSAERAAA